MTELNCFKAYDIRGKLGSELNEEIAYRIGQGFARHLTAKRVVVGCDVRLTSEPLKQALAKGLMDAGADVIDLGVTGSEEIYFAAFHLDVDGGIEVTASHNPIDYNGMKFIGRDAKPIDQQGLGIIKTLAERENFDRPLIKGEMGQASLLDAYIDHLFTYIDAASLNPAPLGPASLGPRKLVVNSGNGAAGRVIDAIEARFDNMGVDIEFIKVHHQPDGNFPNGIPNPLLPENRGATARAVLANQADIGLAWDGDFDRCFFFDENGNFIEGYYMVGLLAQAFLNKNSTKNKIDKKIIYDPRLTWNTIDIVNTAGGTPVVSKTGHAFIKQAMRDENAIYGGEMSAHHYFRDFGYCDSGMIPWLLVLELLCTNNKKLSQLVSERIAAYPCSGELNYQVSSTSDAISHIRKRYEVGQNNEFPVVDTTDGISIEFNDWRFNLRASNTEPLLRLNIEARGDLGLVQRKVSEIEKLIAIYR